MKMHLPTLVRVGMIFGILVSGELHAQHLERTLLSNAGQQSEAEGIMLEWSVGEVAVAEFSDNTYQLRQGFHQGIGLINQVHEPANWNYQIVLFPNPVSRKLYLEKDESAPIKVVVVDPLGRIIWHETWQGNQYELDVREWNAGMYLIRLVDEEGAFAIYQFIKQ